MPPGCPFPFWQTASPSGESRIRGKGGSRSGDVGIQKAVENQASWEGACFLGGGEVIRKDEVSRIEKSK